MIFFVLFRFLFDLSFCADEVSEFSNNFGFSLYAQMIENSDPIEDNIIFSSLSIYNVLNMVLAGAGEDSSTYSQLLEVLQQPFSTLTELEIHEGIKNLIERLEFFDVAAIAQSIFIKNGYTVNEDYFALLSEYYEAEGMNVEFEEPGRTIINEWVAEKTKGLIPELIKPGVISTDTFCVLVNAIYFRNTWKKQFDPELTTPHQFALLGEEDVVLGSYGVDMMEQTSNFRYANHENPTPFKSLTLLYQNENEDRMEYKLILLLPEENTLESMRELENVLIEEGHSFIEMIERDQSEQYDFTWEVHVKLPKFLIEYQSSLKSFLKSLGVTDIFDPSLADLSRISEDENLLVSEVIHQAKMIVDEEGTEAAAATAVIMENTAIFQGSSEKRVFWCHRPFLFLLVHDPSRTVLFQGKVLKPLSTETEDRSSWIQISSYLNEVSGYNYYVLGIPVIGLILCIVLAILCYVFVSKIVKRMYYRRRRGDEYRKYNITLKDEEDDDSDE